MFKIVRFPRKLETFFHSLSDQFHWEHFEYFRMLVLLMAFAWGRRTITNLYRHLDDSTHSHRTRFNNFFNVGRWDPEEFLAFKAHELLKILKPKKGEVAELIIDSSNKQKKGKRMEAVGWIYDPVSGRKYKGHTYVKAAIRFRNYTIPLGIRLYVKAELCGALGMEFKKLTHLAAELIETCSPPEGLKVYALFDIYYLCPVVVNACKRKGFHFIAPVKSNRNLFKNGRKLKAGKYAKNLFRRSTKQAFTLKKQDRTKQFQYVDAGWMEVSSLGSLHLIVSRRKGERTGISLVTDDKKLTPKKMIEFYDDRWNIEVFFRDAKQLLGFGQYQNSTYRAAVTHLHLVCFAYALLTHIAIEGESAQGKTKQSKIPSTADLQNELRRIVWEDFSKQVRKLPDGKKIFRELDRLFIAA